MNDRFKITRRTALKTSTAVAAALATGKWASAGGEPMKYAKSDFYDNGVFSTEKALKAYFDMMARFGYPVSPILKTEELWTSEFAQDDFLNVGMAGVFWINNTDQMYFAHEIFLLPGQMIVEHRHDEVPDGPAKMETWHVRHGMIYTFSDDEPTKDLPVKLPESQLKVDGITALHCEPLLQGEMSSLNRLEAPHFMMAGPEGAIVSEYASPHYDDALKFTNKTVVF